MDTLYKVKEFTLPLLTANSLWYKELAKIPDKFREKE
jgi:hypothetical protein